MERLSEKANMLHRFSSFLRRSTPIGGRWLTQKAWEPDFYVALKLECSIMLPPINHPALWAPLLSKEGNPCGHLA